MVVGAIIYIVAARRGAGATVGEALLQTSYISGRQLPRRPQEAWQAARALLAGSPDELRPTADLLRALADPDRLRAGAAPPRPAAHGGGAGRADAAPRASRCATSSTGSSPPGSSSVEAEGDDERSQIRPDLVAPLLEFLVRCGRRSVPAAAGEPTGAAVRVPSEARGADERSAPARRCLAAPR